MLCSFCEGTENSPLPHTHLMHSGSPLQPVIPITAGGPDDCPECGESLWETCPECAGEGRHLKILGSCASCGRLIPYWYECLTCRGDGRVYSVRHDCLAAQLVSARRTPRRAIAHPGASTRSGTSHRPAA